MTDETYVEPVTLDHREWPRNDTHVLTLLHRAGRRHNAWLIRHHHTYKGGGSFGYSHVLAEDSAHGFTLVQKLYSAEQLSAALQSALRHRV